MKYQTNLYIGLSMALLLASCASEMPDSAGILPTPGSSADSQIEIFAGVPASLTGTTRAIEEPSRPGVCDADRCLLWFYEGGAHDGSLSTTHNFKVSDLNIADSVTVNADRYGDLYAQNKLASYLYDFRAANSGAWVNHFNARAIPSLAYSEKDAAKFMTDTKSFGNTPDHLTLSIVGTDTPELYFGRLSFPLFAKPETKEDDQMISSGDGVFYYHHRSFNAEEHNNLPVTGRLYRLVSQMNVTIKDIPEGEIEKLELYVSSFPVRMTLFGNHGAFYPVSTASSHIGDENNYIRVATCDHLHRGEARLSTFLLPSTVGYKMKVRVYFPEGRVVDNNGNPVRYKDCDIRPAKSVFMKGNDAEVYFDGAPAALRDGNNLFVYKDTERCFYSYSNVRINISGDLDNVLRETTPVDIQVEICPSFQNSHDFEI